MNALDRLAPLRWFISHLEIEPVGANEPENGEQHDAVSVVGEIAGNEPHDMLVLQPGARCNWVLSDHSAN